MLATPNSIILNFRIYIFIAEFQSHYLLFNNGFQTWEYAPQYALRSYLYLLSHTVLAWIYNTLFHPSRLLLFYFMRCSLAVLCAFTEVQFYK